MKKINKKTIRSLIFKLIALFVVIVMIFSIFVVVFR